MAQVTEKHAPDEAKCAYCGHYYHVSYVLAGMPELEHSEWECQSNQRAELEELRAENEMLRAALIHIRETLNLVDRGMEG